MNTRSKTTKLQKLANATKTYYDCCGHKKAAKNAAARIWLAQELAKKNVVVPDDDELYAMGIFNGDGSC